ncbi:MAG TPA: hypothetical protein VFL53_00040 [Pseudolabrys sp.]|nr:hypothetical protein [Pseudolabrys sp.]
MGFAGTLRAGCNHDHPDDGAVTEWIGENLAREVFVRRLDAERFCRMKIKIVVHEAEDGFWAEVPAIPGITVTPYQLPHSLRIATW